jgi:uncharacterized protein (TIGR02265 family)
VNLLHARELLNQKPNLRRELKTFIEWIDETPAANTVKGMYVGGLLQALDTMGVEAPRRERLHAFKDYPLRDYMDLLLDSALTLYPETTAHDGLLRLGRLAIPTFATSIIGKVIMGTVGRSWELGLKFVSRGYEVSLKPGKCVVAELGNGSALLQLRNIWNFGDSYQVGVIDGLMDWCGVQGRIVAQVISRSDVDLKIEWQPERIARRSRSQPPPSRIAPPSP